MQTHTQIRRRTTKHRSFFAPRRVHEQTGAGEDAVALGCDNPAIDPATGAEVISIDDYKFHGTESNSEGGLVFFRQNGPPFFKPPLNLSLGAEAPDGMLFHH